MITEMIIFAQVGKNDPYDLKEIKRMLTESNKRELANKITIDTYIPLYGAKPFVRQKIVGGQFRNEKKTFTYVLDDILSEDVTKEVYVLPDNTIAFEINNW